MGIILTKCNPHTNKEREGETWRRMTQSIQEQMQHTIRAPTEDLEKEDMRLLVDRPTKKGGRLPGFCRGITEGIKGPVRNQLEKIRVERATPLSSPLPPPPPPRSHFGGVLSLTCPHRQLQWRNVPCRSGLLPLPLHPHDWGHLLLLL